MTPEGLTGIPFAVVSAAVGVSKVPAPVEAGGVSLMAVLGRPCRRLALVLNYLAEIKGNHLDLTVSLWEKNFFFLHLLFFI